MTPLDRYSVIQSFFNQQAVSPLSRKHLHPSSLSPSMLRQYSSSTSKPPSTQCPTCASPSPPPSPTPPEEPTASSPPPDPHLPSARLALFSTYPSSLRRLASKFHQATSSSDPHSRPTKADLLKLTNSFWERARIRWKWWTIRGFRKFNADDWSAVASWVIVGNLGWLFIGTTTFFGMVLLTANSLSLQGHIARLLSDYFTEGSGITVVFESALAPNMLQSTISLRNVYISRRPKSATPSSSFSASSSSSLPSAYLHLEGPEAHDHEEATMAAVAIEEEDVNYSMFDLNVDSIDVTLSFNSWLNGEGIVKKAVVRGVRGVVDRRNVTWDPSNPWLPSEWRHPSTPNDGSFQLDSLIVEDLLCTVYQPEDFRPYNVSIFKADLKTFRKKWLFLDVLSAESITGQYDNCLFSLHKPQRVGKTMSADEQDKRGKRMTRMRIDGLPIDHLQGSSASGPLAWITSGKLDGVVDIQFPRHPDEDLNFTSVLSEIIDNVNEIASPPHSSSSGINPGQRPLGRPALIAPEWFGARSAGEEEERREVVLDIDLRFRDLKAAVPFRTGELGYVNSALIRPIVAFINANRTLLPIQCRVVQDLNEFDGSWTPFETGLLDATSAQVYSALAHHVTSQSANTQRIKAVGVWSLQMTAEMVVSAVRAAVLQGKELGLELGVTA